MKWRLSQLAFLFQPSGRRLSTNSGTRFGSLLTGLRFGVDEAEVEGGCFVGDTEPTEGAVTGTVPCCEVPSVEIVL